MVNNFLSRQKTCILRCTFGGSTSFHNLAYNLLTFAFTLLEALALDDNVEVHKSDKTVLKMPFREVNCRFEGR